MQKSEKVRSSFLTAIQELQSKQTNDTNIIGLNALTNLYIRFKNHLAFSKHLSRFKDNDKYHDYVYRAVQIDIEEELKTAKQNLRFDQKTNKEAKGLSKTSLTDSIEQSKAIIAILEPFKNDFKIK